MIVVCSTFTKTHYCYPLTDYTRNLTYSRIFNRFLHNPFTPVLNTPDCTVTTMHLVIQSLIGEIAEIAEN